MLDDEISGLNSIHEIKFRKERQPRPRIFFNCVLYRQGDRVWIYARKRAQTFVFGFGATLGLIPLGFLTVAPEPLRFIGYIFGFAFAVFAITATFSWAVKVTVIDKAKGYAGRHRRNCLGMERVETANLADFDRVVLFRQLKSDASGKRSYTWFELRLAGSGRLFVVWGTSGSLSRSQIENGKELAAFLDLPFDDRSMPGDFPQKNAWLFEDEASQMGIDPCLAHFPATSWTSGWFSICSSPRKDWKRRGKLMPGKCCPGKGLWS